MKMLDTLVSLGVRQAVLTSNDGLVIESAGKDTPHPDLLAAEISSLGRTSRTLSQSLGGDTRRLTLATDDREILVVFFNDYCLGAVVERGTDRKGIGNELSRLAIRLSHSL